MIYVNTSAWEEKQVSVKRMMAVLTAISGLAMSSAERAGAQEARQRDPVEKRQISLEQAIGEALQGNAGLGIARSRSEAVRAASKAETAGLFPVVDLSAGYVRTTDPAKVFAIKLQQGRFTEADFAIPQLNDPDPIGDWTAGASFSWSLLDPTRWAGKDAAAHRAQAASWSAQRTREATIFQTKLMYFRAVQARERLEAERTTAEAARATVERFSKRLSRGLITRADLLQAEAELEAAEARLIAVEDGNARIAEQLGLHLGWDPGILPVASDTLLPPPEPSREEFDPETRSDLRSLKALEDAAASDATRATMAFVPALDAFGDFRSHAAEAFESDGTDWTVGFALRWNLFSGLRRSAERTKAQLEREALALERAEALRAARNEAVQARRGVVATRRSWRAMEAARLAAGEGRDLMRRRFEEGLATATDLLQAEARAAEMRSRAVDALADHHIAIARLEFVESRPDPEES